MKEKKQHNIDIGDRIRIARDAAGYTQELFAELVDVSVQYVSDLERGVTGTSVPTLMKICTVLCVSSDFLLFGTPAGNTESIDSAQQAETESDGCDFTIQMSKLNPQQQKILRKSIQVLFEAFHCSDIK